MTFVDSNVLVYAHDAADSVRQERAALILRGLWRTRTGIVSTQVLTEFYAVATRKLTPPMSRAEARSIVASYAAWPVVQVDATLVVAASRLEEQHKLSFWDAMIVEAARRGGATVLYSEDLQHGRRIGGVQILNPLRD
ncbi:MAG TPA: PIN domain-containing protein [Acidimicrobiales bacterium]|nr:PIN domain-containing protein [Acidimicrobiales bacterium]